MDMTKVIQNAEELVQKLLGRESTGHDWWHMVRVRNIARTIHAVEGGDWPIIELTLLLHDVGDRKVISKDEDDYTIAENFLSDQKVDSQIISKIMHIIKNMSFSKTLTTKRDDASIEFKIVQDADRIDAIGAIGIARAFAFGGSKDRLLYDPTAEAFHASSTEEYRTHKGSTYHHFEEKLLFIKHLLNTETAHKIAEQRDDFMRVFLAQFLDEWDGKK